MVRQLEQSGEKIAFCALIDTPEPNSDTGKDIPMFTPENEIGFIKQHFTGIDIERTLANVSKINDIWPMVLHHLESNDSYLEKIEPLIKEYKAHFAPGNDRIEISQLINSVNMGRTLFRARAAYIPSQKINTFLHYFWANQSTGKIKEHWNKYCTQPVEFYEVRGDHFSIFKRPNVVEFAQIFAEALQIELNRTKA
jgi:thioesterase domain-containing protein